MNWKTSQVVDSYQDAAVLAASLNCQTKIRRTGPNGLKFKVKFRDTELTPEQAKSLDEASAKPAVKVKTRNLESRESYKKRNQ